MQHWNSDTMLRALLGDSWATEMELHNDATLEQNVETANSWLLDNGHTGKLVMGCRETEDGSELEWLCNFAVVVS